MKNFSKNIFYNIFSLISGDHKKKFKFLIFLIFLCSILEFITIGLVPIIIIIITDKIPSEYLVYLSYLDFFEIQNLIVFFAIILISVFFVRLLINIFYLWRLSGFLLSLKSYLSEKLIRSLFSLDYLEFKKRSVSSTTRLIIDEKNVVISNYFTAVLSLALEIITFIPYILICILLDYKIFLSIAIFSIVIFFIIKINLFPKIKFWGSQRLKFDAIQHKKIQETILASKNVYLDNLLDKLLKNITYYVNLGANFEKKNLFFLMMPRFFLEFFAVLVLSFFIILFSSSENLISYLPILGTYLVMIFKLLPSLNRILQANQSIKFSEPSVNSLIDNMKFFLKKVKINQYGSKKNIKINSVLMSNIKFGYEKTILNSPDVEFKNNDIVHISGASGSGKTTFIELLSGLIRNGCKLNINGNELSSDEDYSNFQQRISYVPQNTFLFDDTIMNNIKFSQNLEDAEKLKIDKIIDICFLNDLLNQNKKDFKIGEFGSKLSGGQKQRVSIARSLVKNSDILILDESTNALDFESESKIMSNIVDSKFFKIIILISHNQKLTNYCNKILKINNRQIIMI